MSRRDTWSVPEIALVQRCYATHPAAAIARRLWGEASPRRVGAVYRLAAVLGLRRGRRWPAEVLARVQALHARGCPDREIARRLPETFAAGAPGRDQVKHCRQRLRLPCNPDLEGKRRAVRKQLASLGIRSGGELRALSHRKYAVENGWPAELRPREVQILNALAARGVPMTKHELAEAIGMPASTKFRSGKRRILLSGNGPGGTYTASLARRGLVVNLGRLGTVLGRGKGRSRCLFALGPAALGILAQRCQEAGA